MDGPQYSDRPIMQVLQDIVANIQEIMRSEIRLAKAEMKQESSKAARARAVLAGGTVLAVYGLVFLLLAIVYALSLAVKAWLAALIVAVITGVIAASYSLLYADG
jgi:uncharacterized membrane protein YqjE